MALDKMKIIKILLACQGNQFMKWYGCRFVGRLITPQFQSHGIWHDWTGIDNCAFTDWQPLAFRKLLCRYSKYAHRTKWVCCPDVVGDCIETRKRFDEWSKDIKSLGYSIAYVLQDGQESKNVPWDDIQGVFLGGSTEYKLSNDAYTMLEEAKWKEKLIHVGRVNSLERMERFLPVADSIDGLTFSFYSRTHLPKLIDFLEEYYNV